MINITPNKHGIMSCTNNIRSKNKCRINSSKCLRHIITFSKKYHHESFIKVLGHHISEAQK